jgi:hypothetical protein
MTRILVVLVIVLAAPPAWAHAPSDAQLRLSVDGELVTGRLDVALRDLDAAVGLDADADGAITWRELAAAEAPIADYVRARLDLGADGQPCEVALDRGAVVERSSGAAWALPITATCSHRPERLAIGYRLLFDLDARHRGLVHLDDQTLIVRDANPVSVRLGEETSVLAFVREGVWHIWIGLDHLLFLACLILPAVTIGPGRQRRAATSLRATATEVLEIVTAFTLAHSITLIISAIGLVQMPSRIVETAIALSVVVAAVNNLARFVDARWAVAFALGLLHGFGFSSVLLDLGLPSGQLVGALLGFNLGVELGQLAVVAALIPILYLIRRTLAYQALLWGGSTAAALIAAMWTYERWVA